MIFSALGRMKQSSWSVHMSPFKQFWPTVPHVPDHNKQLTPFHLSRTHNQGFGMVDSSRSIFAYQLSAIFGTALRSWSSLTSLSLPWWGRLAQEKKCDYDYDYICMLIERFRVFIRWLPPRSNENSRMEWHKLFLAQLFQHATQHTAWTFLYLIKYTSSVYNRGSFLKLYETLHDLLKAALACIDEIRHTQSWRWSSGGSAGTSNANDPQSNETHRSWDTQPERHFACTCDSKQKWQHCPGIQILVHPRELFKTTNLSALLD